MRARPCFLCRILLGYEGDGCIKHDNLAQLALLVEQAGGSLTLYGNPTSPGEIRRHAADRLAKRLGIPVDPDGVELRVRR